MAMPKLDFPTDDTLQDALERLGSVPLNRIRWTPRPGTAREEDVLAHTDGDKRLLELIDGVLVEKPMGYYESLLAITLVRELGKYLDAHNIGFLLGADAHHRLKPGNVRLPDVSFVLWSRLPDRKLPREQIAPFAPDLVVEVISPGNTVAEMDRKLREYFAAGTQLAWLVYPEKRMVRVYHVPDQYMSVPEDGIVDGEDLLPGFSISVRDWFELAGPPTEE